MAVSQIILIRNGTKLKIYKAFTNPTVFQRNIDSNPKTLECKRDNSDEKEEVSIFKLQSRIWFNKWKPYVQQQSSRNTEKS